MDYIIKHSSPELEGKIIYMNCGEDACGNSSNTKYAKHI